MITIQVKQYFQRCGVREKGREFYGIVKNIIPEGENNVQFDFKNVTYVSASFLEESIFRFLKDYNVSIIERSKALERKAERIIHWKNLNVQLSHEKNLLRFTAY